MRVIEPRQFQTGKHKKKRSKRGGLGLLVVFLLAAGGSYVGFKHFSNSKQVDQARNQQTTTALPAPQPDTTQSKKLKTFTGEEFKKLYNSFAYPNTQSLQEKPLITGNDEADARIQKIAEERGYKLSAVPVASIVKTGEPDLEGDDLMQPNALIAWQEMKAAALKEGVKLQLTSAYRSIELQRALFVRRMQNEGVYVDSVANGYVDDLVVRVLTRVAPPGYSRHHTGYTMDLACDGIGLEAFLNTPCYSWLSKNNYENTKKFGWVPSYPEGAAAQGPEPEPWEFIWVSTYSLYE